MHGGSGTLPPGGFKHLLHMFPWCRTPKGKLSLQSIKKVGDFYTPSATDLQLSATVFEKHAGIHVSYCDKRLYGMMQIALWHILAFEWCYMDCGFPVTVYDVRMPNDLNILSEKVRAHHERSYSRSYVELKSHYFLSVCLALLYSNPI